MESHNVASGAITLDGNATPTLSGDFRFSSAIRFAGRFVRDKMVDLDGIIFVTEPSATCLNQRQRLDYEAMRENGDEGYVAEVECILALREKIDQLSGDFADVDPKSAVRTTKSELTDIATEVGFSIHQEPFTRAENHKLTLEAHPRKQLQEYKYGLC